MPQSKTKNRANFEYRLATDELWSIATELQSLREHPPLKYKKNGHLEGSILSFVKGLRISARLIYFLRNCLSEEDCEVSWGHILNASGQSCSPECDVIIHKKGHVKRWNGSGNSDCVMDFKFIRAKKVTAVISCKSIVADIDDDYPSQLKSYGVSKVYLFGECCSQSNYSNLRKKAKSAGYVDLFCAYFIDTKNDSPIRDDNHHYDFYDSIRTLF